MNANIPEDWVPISDTEFEKALSAIDYTRDGWSNGIFYRTRYRYGYDFAVLLNDGKILIDPQFKP